VRTWPSVWQPERTSVGVDAREFRDTGNPKLLELGIAIEVKESARLKRSSTSFIDHDEIDSPVCGLGYIRAANNFVTSLTNFEVGYPPKGDFAVTISNQSRGGIGLAVSTGRIG
jgi:hypothetical protein